MEAEWAMGLDLVSLTRPILIRSRHTQDANKSKIYFTTDRCIYVRTLRISTPKIDIFCEEQFYI